jgi:hypothetical protein
MRRLCSLALVLCAALPAAAQAVQPGLYDAIGTDTRLGAFRGQVQVVDRGTHIEVIRSVRYQQTPAASGRPLTCVWIGVGVRSPNRLQATFPLERMDWITSEPGGLTRSAADRLPDVATASYRPDPSGGLSGAVTSAGGVSIVEALTRVGAAGTPLMADLRQRTPLHRPWPRWLKSILFGALRSYHALPVITPFTPRADFQGAVFQGLTDRSAFTWLRSHPGELLLLDRRVDAISVLEAEQVRSAYGLRLVDKAAGYDRDAVTRHRDPVTGMLSFGVRQTPSGLEHVEDMSSLLWSACWAFGQSRRYQTTQDPEALDNVARYASTLCDMIEIDPQPGEFARSLRPVGRSPISGSWRAGTGPYAHLAYHVNGNNDMIKGVWLGFIAAWDILPANHPLRPRIVRCVREIADDWATSNPGAAGGTGHKRTKPKSTLVNNMLAQWITGDSKYESVWRATLRKPMFLAELASGGQIAFFGMGDWSGTHLGVCGAIAMVELSRKLNTRWKRLFELTLRMGNRSLKNYRMTPWSVAAAVYLGDRDAALRALWELREFPYPKRHVVIDRTLDRTFSYAPIPEKPWKRDWMQGGRHHSIYSYPVYMRGADNYAYRSTPFSKGANGGTMEHHGGDYLFAYWMARAGGVVPANE